MKSQSFLAGLAFGVIGTAAFYAYDHLGAAEPEIRTVSAEKADNAPSTKDKDKRVVAYIHGNTAITREEFGDFLISRFGAENLSLYVNRRIIETAAEKRGIVVTDIEVNATIKEDCATMGIPVEQFVAVFLKQQKQTLPQWREDVIRPRLMLAKMYRDQIKITDEDLKNRYEYRFGKKVKARIIVWPKDAAKQAVRDWDEVRKSEEEFDRKARNQGDPNLAARGGAVEPIGRHSADDTLLEDEAFKLKEGEVSRLIETKIGFIVIKCTGHVAEQKEVAFEKVKDQLRKEVLDTKMAHDVKSFFQELALDAKPQLFIQPDKVNFADIERAVQQEVAPLGNTKK